jgi:hypothetical protein
MIDTQSAKRHWKLLFLSHITYAKPLQLPNKKILQRDKHKAFKVPQGQLAAHSLLQSIKTTRNKPTILSSIQTLKTSVIQLPTIKMRLKHSNNQTKKPKQTTYKRNSGIQALKIKSLSKLRS